MKNLPTILQRIFIGSIFGALSSLLLFTSQLAFLVFITLLIVLVIFEYAAVCTKKRISPLLIALFIFLGLRGYNFFQDAQHVLSENSTWLWEQMGIAIIFTALAFPFRQGKYQQVFLFFLGCLWLIMPLFFVFGIFQFPNPKQIFLFLVLIIVANDSFAYFIGKKWGKKKIVPNISPNKTYLGSFAGFVFSLFAALILQWLWNLFNYPIAITIAIGLAISGQIGDLIASKLKRALQIKDYGKILLGHGGMLDRLDSLLFTIPVYYFLIKYLL